MKPLLFETNNRIIPQQVTQGALNTRSNRVILLPNDQSTPNPARANENQQYSLNQFMLGSRGRGYSLPPSVGSSSITSLFEPLPDRNGLSRPWKKEGLGAAHKQFAPSSANDFECYLLPSQICPGPSPFVIRGFLSFIATVRRIRENGSRDAPRPFFFLSPFLLFFFRSELTRSKLMIAASLAAIPGRERDFLFSPLFAARCHFSRVPRFTMEDGRTEQSRTIPFPFEYNGVF